MRDHDCWCALPLSLLASLLTRFISLCRKRIPWTGCCERSVVSAVRPPSQTRLTFSHQIHSRVNRLNYVTTPTSLPLPTPSTPAQLIPQGHYPFLVRIGTSNTASIRLFEKLGFGRVKVVKAFDEMEMRFGWIPAQDEDEEGKMMEFDEMERLAREKWTRRGQAVACE
jgi:hypothetical protein